MLAAIIIGELLSGCLIVYGIIHEEKLIAFEDKIIHRLRVKFREITVKIIRRLHKKIKSAKRTYKIVKVSICARALEKEGLTINKKGA